MSRTATVLLVAALSALAARARAAEAIAAFDAAALETPESIATDWDGNVYVALAITGEIARIDPAGVRQSLAFIPLGAYPAQECAPGDFALLHGIATDLSGAVFAAAAACAPEHRGIWKVTAGGVKERIAALPADAHPNGLALRGDHIYVADQGAGRIFRAPKDGDGGAAEVWLSSPLLALVPNPFAAPGANGIQFYKNTALITNSSQQTIVAVELSPDERAGTPYVAHHVPPGCDDFAVDVRGSIYCTTNPFQTVIRIDRDGAQTVVLTAADGLDGPTAAAFGRLEDMRTLYVANAAFPFFPGTGHGPSVRKVELAIPGYPLR